MKRKDSIEFELDETIRDQIERVNAAEDADRTREIGRLEILLKSRNGIMIVKEKKKTRFWDVAKWAIGGIVLIGSEVMINIFGYGFDYDSGLDSSTFRRGRQKMDKWKSNFFKK